MELLPILSLCYLLSAKNKGGERKLSETHKDDSFAAKEHWRRDGGAERTLISSWHFMLSSEILQNRRAEQNSSRTVSAFTEYRVLNWFLKAKGRVE